MDALKTDNLKLVTDMKILRNEHQEVLNSMFSLERKNVNLQTENEALRRMMMQGSYDNRRGDNTSARAQFTMEDRRQISPFRSEASKIHNVRSLSSNHLRESKENNPIST